MATLPDTPTWVGGIYQIEVTDAVSGGPDGVANVQARQLAQRTAFLKGEVEQLGRVGAVAAGVAVIKNKYVLHGFVLTADTATRTLHLSQTGVVAAGGASRAVLDAVTLSVPDVARHVAVPGNPAAAALTVFAYFRRAAGRVEIAPAVPDDALLLYRLTIPPNDTGASLAGVTLVDMRPVQESNGWFTSFEPSAVVMLPADLPSIAYAVVLDVESATPPGAVGELRVLDKAVNGFRIAATGSADNVRVRWAVLVR